MRKAEGKLRRILSKAAGALGFSSDSAAYKKYVEGSIKAIKGKKRG